MRPRTSSRPQVSGAGQPRNEKANPSDNSTQGVGWLMERFIRLVHPEIEVVHIVSSSYGIFRYDDNVRFVKEQVGAPVADVATARSPCLQALSLVLPVTSL